MKALLKYGRRKLFVSGNNNIRTALDGVKWKTLVYDFDQTLRSEAKYKDNSEAERLREVLREMMYNEGLNLED